MFVPEKVDHLGSSVSSLCNNLEVLESKDDLIFATINKSQVSLFITSKDGKHSASRNIICKDPASNSSTLTVTTLKFLCIAEQDVLVITSSHGLHIYEPDGTKMIYWFSLKEAFHGSEDGQNINFLKGIVALGNDLVCAGTESGHILMFKMSSSSGNVKAVGKFEGHCQAIYELAGSDDSARDLMISGDEEGGLRTWILQKDKLQVKSKVPGGRGSVSDGWPVNSLAIWSENNCALVGFGSGAVRIFDVLTGRLLLEIFAHSRLISSIDWSPHTSLLLTVSEDTTLRLFRLEGGGSGGKDIKICQIQTESVKDHMLQGGRFCSRGRRLCVTSYDSDEIHFFARK